MEKCKAMATPLFVNEKLSNNDANSKVDASVYRRLIGSLLYLLATKPNIMFAASLFSSFMHSPSQTHYSVAKQVLRYIKGTFEYGLCFLKNESEKLQGYANSDWADNLDDSKSICVISFHLGVVISHGIRKNKM